MQITIANDTRLGHDMIVIKLSPLRMEKNDLTSTAHPDNGFLISLDMWKWRLIVVVLVPWIQLSLAIPLAVMGWRAGASWLWVSAWLGIMGLLTLIEGLSLRGPRLGQILIDRRSNRLRLRPTKSKGLSDDEPLALAPYSDAPLAAWNKRFSFIGPMAVLILSWVSAVLAGRLLPPSSALSMLLVLMFGFAVVPFVRVLLARLNHTRSSLRQFSFWLVVAGTILATIALNPLIGDTLTVVSVAAYFALLYGTTYAALRLWTGERGWNEALNELSQTFLEKKYGGDDFNDMAEEIGRRLRYVRIAILVPDGPDHLILAGSHGFSERAAAQRVPIAGSLTGRVYESCAAVACNDVDACAAYVPAENERTKAELAVPVMYRGEIFAVLDVQSPYLGVFDLPDVHTLETIARVIGAILAANRQNRSYEVAVGIWEEIIGEAGHEMANDAALFEHFAIAARKLLGVDLVTYYPLTLSGRPQMEPLISGEFREPEKMCVPTLDVDDVVVPFIVAWQPVFASDVQLEPRFLGTQKPESIGFVKREEVRSACFLPVGTRQERLGALFLNFRKPVDFDAMRKFTALALAQAYTVAASRNRYRTGYHHGFGRPEMNLHNVVGRHGFSYGSHSAGKLAGDLLRQKRDGQGQPCADGKCALMPLVDQIDGLLVELSTLEAGRPPAFHKTTLSQHLKTYIASLPQTTGGRSPSITYSIPPQVDALNPLLKIAIYRFITEGISNALLYAEARAIHVAVEYHSTDISICITNDGKPLPPDAKQRRSAYGIYYLLDKLQEELGADGNLVAEAGGSSLRLNIPCLP